MQEVGASIAAHLEEELFAERQVGTVATIGTAHDCRGYPTAVDQQRVKLTEPAFQPLHLIIFERGVTQHDTNLLVVEMPHHHRQPVGRGITAVQLCREHNVACRSLGAKGIGKFFKADVAVFRRNESEACPWKLLLVCLAQCLSHAVCALHHHYRLKIGIILFGKLAKVIFYLLLFRVGEDNYRCPAVVLGHLGQFLLLFLFGKCINLSQWYESSHPCDNGGKDTAAKQRPHQRRNRKTEHACVLIN